VRQAAFRISIRIPWRNRSLADLRVDRMPVPPGSRPGRNRRRHVDPSVSVLRSTRTHICARLAASAARRFRVACRLHRLDRKLLVMPRYTGEARLGL